MNLVNQKTTAISIFLINSMHSNFYIIDVLICMSTVRNILGCDIMHFSTKVSEEPAVFIFRIELFILS